MIAPSPHLKSLARQFLSYCLVGGFGFLIHSILLYALTEWAGLWYLASSTLALGVVACVNFTLFKLWTFRGR